MKFTLEDPTTWEWAMFLFYTSMFVLLQQSKNIMSRDCMLQKYAESTT